MPWVWLRLRPSELAAINLQRSKFQQAILIISSNLQFNRIMSFSTLSKPASAFFKFATATGLLLFLVVVSSTAPVNKRQAAVDSNITKQIYWGMSLLKEIDGMTAIEASNLGRELLNISQDTPEYNVSC